MFWQAVLLLLSFCCDINVPNISLTLVFAKVSKLYYKFNWQFVTRRSSLIWEIWNFRDSLWKVVSDWFPICLDT